MCRDLRNDARVSDVTTNRARTGDYRHRYARLRLKLSRGFGLLLYSAW